MALWICQRCGAAYSVGAPNCPQCGHAGHTNDYEEGEPMAKITVHGGPTNADAEVEAQPEQVDAPAVPADEAPAEQADSPDIADTATSKRTRK
jgi:predicted  nucleic acid-binding Zn-ribbon protein